MKKSLLFLLFSCCVASVSAQCSSPTDTYSNLGDGNAREVGQTITACGNGTVSSLTIYNLQTTLNNANMTVKFVEKSNCTTATTAGNTKGTTTITNFVNGANVVTFSPSFSIASGTTYYIEITSSVTGALSRMSLLDALDYTGGKMYYKSPTNCGQDDGGGTFFDIRFSLNTVLPIELLSFDVQNTEGSKNKLTWATASEVNNKTFDIERSTDGKTFQSIGQVKGNNKPSSYQFVDNQPFATSYYRLRQVDFDGTETFSKIVSVQLKGKSKGLTIYPTLVSNVLTVEYTEGALFQVINLLGQQVLSGKMNGQRLDVSTLPQGTYILKVGAEQAKFIKQ